MFEAAVLAPDHQQLQPWRFVVIEGSARTELGRHLVQALLRREPDASPGQIDKERSKLERAPLVVVVAARRIETTLPFEELLSAVAAATQNFLLAATDLGYGTMWRTGALAYDPDIKQILGLDPLDAIVGYIYIGTTKDQPAQKRVAVLDGVVTVWDG